MVTTEFATKKIILIQQKKNCNFFFSFAGIPMSREKKVKYSQRTEIYFASDD
jgi:hypothetical protein